MRNRPVNSLIVPATLLFAILSPVGTLATSNEKLPLASYLTAWGSNGSGAQQFNTITDIAISQDAKIFVSDQGNDRIEVFPGPLQNRSATIQYSQGDNFVPVKLAFTRDTVLHVLGTSNHVRRYSPNLTGLSGWDPADLFQDIEVNNVFAITSDRDTSLYFSANAHTIGEGVILKLGASGGRLGYFPLKRPGDTLAVSDEGIAADVQGNIYVVVRAYATLPGAYTKVMREYARDGTFIHEWPIPLFDAQQGYMPVLSACTDESGVGFSTAAYSPAAIIAYDAADDSTTRIYQFGGVTRALAVYSSCRLLVATSSDEIHVLKRDLDSDDLCDAWEKEGLLAPGGSGKVALDSASIRHKDVFVEMDAMSGCTLLSSSIGAVKVAFASADQAFLASPNPDNTNGIRLHVDVDETNITARDWTVSGWQDSFKVVKGDHFGTSTERGTPKLVAKAMIYRYCLAAKGYSEGHVGAAEFRGNDMVLMIGRMPDELAGYANIPDRWQIEASVFMHELGHTMGRLHGGDDTIDWKPNYYSVMNHMYLWPFKDTRQEWKLVFSETAWPKTAPHYLDEHLLVDASGVDGAKSVRFPMLPMKQYPTNGEWYIGRYGNTQGKVDWDKDPNTANCTDCDPTRWITLAGDELEPFHQDELDGASDWGALVFLAGADATKWKNDGAFSGTESNIDAEASYAQLLIRREAVEDCNENHVSDGADISGGSSLDVDNDLVPDECEALRTEEWTPFVVGCPGGHGATVVTVDLTNVQGINLHDSGLALKMVFHDLGTGVYVWTPDGTRLGNGGQLGGTSFDTLTKVGRFDVRYVSGWGQVKWDLVAGGKTIVRNIVSTILSYDVDSLVSGVVDQRDQAAWPGGTASCDGSGNCTVCASGPHNITACETLAPIGGHLGHHIPTGILGPSGGTTFSYWASIVATWKHFRGDSALASVSLMRDGVGRQTLWADIPDSGRVVWNASPVFGGGSGYHVIVEHTDGQRHGDGGNVIAADTSGGFTIEEAQGGCPTVDLWTPEGWQFENTVLGRSTTGALAFDSYRLKSAPDTSGGRVRIRVRESEQEYTTLDQVRLIAIDHQPGARAMPLGDQILLGSSSAPYRVTRSNGDDITQLVTGSGSFVGDAGETLMVAMGGVPSAGAGIERTMPGGCCYEDGDGDKGGGGAPQARLGRAAEVASVDEEILSGTGILIQAGDGQGGWRTVTHRYPREHYDEFLVDSLAYEDTRLVFLARHRLGFIGRFTPSGVATPHVLALSTASHSRLGNVMAALGQNGGLTTELQPGDTLSMEFGSIPIAEGMIRDLFLVTRGVYTSALPAKQHPSEQILPTQFALEQNRPNPFRGTTTIRFALPTAAGVRLEVFDMQGRKVTVLANGNFDAGYQSLDWDHRDGRGNQVRPGVYLYRMRAGSFRSEKKMVLLAN